MIVVFKRLRVEKESLMLLNSWKGLVARTVPGFDDIVDGDALSITTLVLAKYLTMAGGWHVAVGIHIIGRTKAAAFVKDLPDHPGDVVYVPYTCLGVMQAICGIRFGRQS